jgi:hypothetical protein
MKQKIFRAALLALALSAFSPAFSPSPALAAETALKPEINPPGDIPDSQVFVRFTSPSGYSIKVPEGWARRDTGAETVFSDKYNRIALTVTDLAQPLDLALAKARLAPEIEQTGRAVKITKVVAAKLKGGDAVRVIYESNSEPNSVTNKQVRQENERYYFAKNGKLASLDLSAPKGADNVDQWQLISSSFRWK